MSGNTKIPVRDITSMFRNESMDHREVRSARKDRKSSYSANFQAEQASRSKSLERNLNLSNDKVKDLRNLINLKDNQIHELVGKVTKLCEENEKLRNDRNSLVENYNFLYKKVERATTPKPSTNLEKENLDLQNDLKMLKILVFRLNKHIEYYQNVLNEKEIKFDVPQKYSNEHEIAKSWTVNSHLLSPLLNSYEERVSEKNDIIKNYEMELNQVSIKFKKILDENENLHELYESLGRESQAWVAEKERLMSQCDILKSKAAIHSKRADLAKEKLMEILKVYEQKVQSQALDIERLQEAYNRSKGEITTLKNMQKNPDALADSIKDFQNLFEELKIQFETEKREMMEEKQKLNHQLNQQVDITNQMEAKVLELNGLLEKQRLCNETLIEKNKNLKKSLHYERQSKETVEKEMNEIREYGNDKYKESWHNLGDLQTMLQEKEIIIQNMKFHQQKEIEDLRNKLFQRDQTLRKILESKLTTSTK